MLGFTFKVFICFEFIFTSAVKYELRFILYIWLSSCSVLREIILSSLNCLCTFVKNQLATFVWSVSGLCVPLIYDSLVRF